ncbi:non-oxidative hydroxyarylic acid decarboxylases subunit D [Streptomyces sp. NPDC058249]|uniref:non-oxidative hydroxyarylic acid decarboxylases subunit D n=1 Tax=Streptomyces sp. NPDC058249 TaxID=3346403 RepID=UPI0036E3CFE3
MDQVVEVRPLRGPQVDASATAASEQFGEVQDVHTDGCAERRPGWRTTEPDRRTRREAYPVEFRMTRADIDDAPEVPVVPPLTTG